MGRKKLFWILIWSENGMYVAYEPSTCVASQGETIDEALENLREALKLYLEESRGVPQCKETPLEVPKKVMITMIAVETPES